METKPQIRVIAYAKGYTDGWKKSEEQAQEIASLKAQIEELSTAKSIWRCKKCGRLAPYRFYAHATRPWLTDYCDGKVAKLR
jgi:DNA invertase Pin-like site-specific DNA recombinase